MGCAHAAESLDGQDSRRHVWMPTLQERRQLGAVVALAVDDGQRQALRDGGLADARLAEQHRVVLPPPSQDLHDPRHLPAAANDWVQPVLQRLRCQESVGAQTMQSGLLMLCPD